MGETSSEKKREIDETRAHLTETLDTIQLRARRSLDLRYQLAHNRLLQLSIGLTIFALVGTGFVIGWQRSRLTPAQRLVRRLKLAELRERLNEFSDEARAVAQKRILRAEKKAVEGAPPKTPALRRIAVSAAEAAATAIAAAVARQLMDRSRKPHDEAHPPADMSSHR